MTQQTTTATQPQTHEDRMQELNRRVSAAVARSVEKGVPERAAFRAHLKALAYDYPAVYGAYVLWLMKVQ